MTSNEPMNDERNVTVKADRLNGIPREFLEIECRAALEANAELRAQLTEQEKRLAAAEAIVRLQGQGDFPPRVFIGEANNGTWFVEHDDEDGNRMPLMRDEACPMYYDTWYDAYLAAVAQGWLPEPKKGA